MRWVAPEGATLLERADRHRMIGAVHIPTTVSIAGALVTRWYGAELPKPPSD